MRKPHLFVDLDSFQTPYLTEENIGNLLKINNKTPKNKLFIEENWYDENIFLKALIDSDYNFMSNEFDLLDPDVYMGLVVLLWENTEIDEYKTFFDVYKETNYGKIGLNYLQKFGKRYVFDVDSLNELHCTDLSEHNEYIDWTAHKYLPNLDYSNEVIKNYHKENRLVLDLGNAEKKAFAEEKGSEVARRNFYKKSDVLSNCETTANKLRTIFYIKKEGKYQFLSIDFKGSNAFEVLDDDGTHLGEYLFDGNANKKAEEAGHSLSKDCIKKFKKDMKNKRL
jgi:hypothetical protein